MPFNPYFFSTKESILENICLSSINVKNYFTIVPTLASVNIGEIRALEESTVTEKAIDHRPEKDLRSAEDLLSVCST